MDGEGKLTHSSGDVYVGMFLKGKKHGKGKLNFKNGEIQEGDWAADKMHGKGKYCYLDSKVFEGEYVEGAPYGYGVMSGPTFIYKGYFKSGLFEGKGILEDSEN
jgi:hypothetical protein